MRELRRHLIVRLVVCILLTWTAVDLLVPQLCAEEGLSQGRSEDCFCCCSHVVDPKPFAALLVGREVVIVADVRIDALAPGVPRSLYHPPIRS